MINRYLSTAKGNITHNFQDCDITSFLIIKFEYVSYRLFDMSESNLKSTPYIIHKNVLYCERSKFF